MIKLCGASEEDERYKREAANAWEFVLSYISNHRWNGRTKLGGLNADLTLMPDTPAPELPEILVIVLSKLGGSPPLGIKRIADSLGTDQATWLRKEFTTEFLNELRRAA